MTASHDIGQLAGLLRREPRICTQCAAAKLAFTLERVVEAVQQLLRKGAIEDELSGCPICGRTSRVVRLAT